MHEVKDASVNKNKKNINEKKENGWFTKVPFPDMIEFTLFSHYADHVMS